MRLIDVRHLGRERVIGCWQVGDVLVDPGPASCLDALLAALGDERPRALLLTHIHLDHAGASGSLTRRWPDLEVYVHERGARHMADPARLLESARRLYGEDMDRLWGEFLPVPDDNLRVLQGGEKLEGGFEVAYTPGHASHHVSYLRDGTAFVGDVGGVRIPPSEFIIPPTPPPDIDIEAWHASIERIVAWRPDRLAMTHFGSAEDPLRHLEAMHGRLDDQAELARRGDRDAFLGRVARDVAAAGDAETAAAYAQAAPQDQLYAGLARYWRKREEASRPTVS
ncbi:MAG TPA: MBL fold metallo-hydrolase [Solirubrobacteraceae bacterium]|jgi:glyoxylase-like metal-dependent hydrolase (beta-lactamase superfamily II)|nr:MBL fold metallo-hydrolase [Solirubrobacteraceae bacterium]